MIDLLISALEWCDKHPDAGECHLCPMFKHERRPCSYMGDPTVSDFLRKYKDVLAEDTDWFGVVRWCDDDIKEALVNHGFDDCEDNVAIIRKQCEHHCFREAMIETGNDYINCYIQENEDVLNVRT